MTKTKRAGKPRGTAKTGGRSKGTPNKRTQDLILKLEELGCDPIQGMAEIAMDEDTATDLRVRCYAELAQYVHAKRKAIELAGEDGNELRVVIERIGGNAART
ncbi:MAG: hypothetical protein H0X25_08785 [Acidobacteriales bacterium]|nr:hypothetical protein [Terriglobales bacterium]